MMYTVTQISPQLVRIPHYNIIIIDMPLYQSA